MINSGDERVESATLLAQGRFPSALAPRPETKLEAVLHGKRTANDLKSRARLGPARQISNCKPAASQLNPLPGLENAAFFARALDLVLVPPSFVLLSS